MSWAELSLYIQSRNTSDQSQDDTGRAGMEAGQLHDDEGRCDAQSMRLNSSVFHWMHIICFQPQRSLGRSIDLLVVYLTALIALLCEGFLELEKSDGMKHCKVA